MVEFGMMPFGAQSMLGPFFAMLSVLFFVFLVLAIILYIYYAWALMVIAQKTQTPNAWLAWIPFANLYLMTQVAKVPAWTALSVLLPFLLFWIPFVNVMAVLAFFGVFIWWWWKIAEARHKPGWLALLFLLAIIPFVNFIGWLAPLIVVGLIAWSD